MQHHRTPFTRSRFVTDEPTGSGDTRDAGNDRPETDADRTITSISPRSRYIAERAETVYTPSSRSHLVDTGPVDVVRGTEHATDTSSPWDRSHESDDYATSAPAYVRQVRDRRSVPAATYLATPPTDVTAVKRSGSHRIPAPPSALKGRVAVVAVAAGAVVAAGQAAMDNTAPAETSEYALAAGQAPAAPATAASVAGLVPADTAAHIDSIPTATSTGAPVTTPTSSTAPQILNIAAPVDLNQFSELLAKGQRFSEEREAREAAARRPLFALPALGTYTSGYGARWGTLHAGIDIANAIGTPVYAVADGVVVDSGPAAGFGLWVRIQHSDGTITVYGHIDSSEVQVGQTVMAGDEIAKMGNRGQSTGPHLHFEVHLAGESKIDPLPWLASRGISLGPERD